jgi:ABC-type dipeptide/oligopeptide/nickel transport system ATPase subunit
MTATSTFSVALANETATAELMADLALLIGAGDVITLSGDLGAGKTAAARVLAVLACVWQRGHAALSLFDTERTAVCNLHAR